MVVVEVVVGRMGKGMVVVRCRSGDWRALCKTVETEGCTRAAVCSPEMMRIVRRCQVPSRYIAG